MGSLSVELLPDGHAYYNNVIYSRNVTYSSYDILQAQNVTNSTQDVRDERIAVIEVAVSATILFLAIVGNGCVLATLYMRRRRRLSRMQLMILHLSLADLFVAFFNVLPQLVWDVTFRFQGGGFLCKSVKYLQVVAMYASAYVLLATATDRYLAICHPFMSQSWTPRHAHLMVIMAWTASLLLSLPQLFIFSLTEVDTGVYDCWAQFDPMWTLPTYITWTTISIFVVPTCVLVCLYGKISWVVWKAGRLEGVGITRGKIISTEKIERESSSCTTTSHSIIIMNTTTNASTVATTTTTTTTAAAATTAAVFGSSQMYKNTNNGDRNESDLHTSKKRRKKRVTKSRCCSSTCQYLQADVDKITPRNLESSDLSDENGGPVGGAGGSGVCGSVESCGSGSYVDDANYGCGGSGPGSDCYSIGTNHCDEIGSLDKSQVIKKSASFPICTHLTSGGTVQQLTTSVHASGPFGKGTLSTSCLTAHAHLTDVPEVWKRQIPLPFRHKPISTIDGLFEMDVCNTVKNGGTKCQNDNHHSSGLVQTCNTTMHGMEASPSTKNVTTTFKINEVNNSPQQAVSEGAISYKVTNEFDLKDSIGEINNSDEKAVPGENVNNDIHLGNTSFSQNEANDKNTSADSKDCKILTHVNGKSCLNEDMYLSCTTAPQHLSRSVSSRLTGSNESFSSLAFPTKHSSCSPNETLSGKLNVNECEEEKPFKSVHVKQFQSLGDNLAAGEKELSESWSKCNLVFHGDDNVNVDNDDENDNDFEKANGHSDYETVSMTTGTSGNHIVQNNKDIYFDGESKVCKENEKMEKEINRAVFQLNGLRFKWITEKFRPKGSKPINKSPPQGGTDNSFLNIMNDPMINDKGRQINKDHRPSFCNEQKNCSSVKDEKFHQHHRFCYPRHHRLAKNCGSSDQNQSEKKENEKVRRECKRNCFFLGCRASVLTPQGLPDNGQTEYITSEHQKSQHSVIQQNAKDRQQENRSSKHQKKNKDLMYSGNTSSFQNYTRVQLDRQHFQDSCNHHQQHPPYSQHLSHQQEELEEKQKEALIQRQTYPSYETCNKLSSLPAPSSSSRFTVFNFFKSKRNLRSLQTQDQKESTQPYKHYGGKIPHCQSTSASLPPQQNKTVLQKPQKSRSSIGNTLSSYFPLRTLSYPKSSSVSLTTSSKSAAVSNRSKNHQSFPNGSARVPSLPKPGERVKTGTHHHTENSTVGSNHTVGRTGRASACVSSGISRAKLKTIKLTLTVVICYVVCWLPFFAGQMWAAFDENAPYQSKFFTIIMLLASVNSCTNPWIYTIFSNTICRHARICFGLKAPSRMVPTTHGTETMATRGKHRN